MKHILMMSHIPESARMSFKQVNLRLRKYFILILILIFTTIFTYIRHQTRMYNKNKDSKCHKLILQCNRRKHAICAIIWRLHILIKTLYSWRVILYRLHYYECALYTNTDRKEFWRRAIEIYSFITNWLTDILYKNVCLNRW